MCGIFGYIGTKKINLKAVTDIIEHRGPDAEGYLGYQVDNKKLGYGLNESLLLDGFRVLFGFRRLAIIDLSHGADQPFSIPGRGLHVVFNGEIYNYLEIKAELQRLGHFFQTQSDTEVLLHAYDEWGEHCVEHFNGMWAFAILDEKRNRVFCSRDRFGVKPFYYYHSTNGFFFCSEIKQLFAAGVHKEINENVIRDFLDKSLTDFSEETFFKDVFQLKAGHSLTIQLENENARPEQAKHWELHADDAYRNISYADAQAEFTRLFSESIRLRFRSDVSVGSCLSGGLDSSAIVSQAATMFHYHINTFTSRFDIKEFDESYYANLVVNKFSNVRPHFCSLNENILQTEIDRLVYHQDEPFPTFGIMAQWEVMKLAKANNVVVLLDGQGGDELLGGYRKYYAFYLKELLQNFQLASFARNSYYLFRNKEFNFFSKEGIKRYMGASQANFLSAKGASLATRAQIGLGSVSTMNEKSKEDIEYFSFPPLLRYEDRNSMAHSIEARVPFMDYRLVRFVYSLPATYKIRHGFTKSLLRDSLKGVLPEETRTRISKLGFATPQSEWMKNSLNSYFHAHFSKMDNPYLNNKMITTEFEKYPASTLHSWDFSRFFIFDRWYQQHFS